MVSTFTTNKHIEQPANGDYAGTWDVPVNADWAVIDKALGGATNINVTGVSGTTVLSITQYQPLIINFSGVLTANLVYQIPSGIGGQWNVNNTTTGNFTITMSSGGGGITTVIPQGFITQVYSDGTNIQQTNTSAAIPNNTVTNTKLAQMPPTTIKSNITGATANPGDNTLTSVLDTISNSPGSLLYRGSSAWSSVAPGAVGQQLASQGTGSPTWASNVKAPVRQTVLYGSQLFGIPNILPATSASLSLTTQFISTGTLSLVVTAAAGFNNYGSVDYLGVSNTNITWSGLAPNSTNYLFVTVNADGTLTPGSTVFQPIYQTGGSDSTVNGQYTFDIQAYIMFVGNGSSVSTARVVFIGEATTNASTVTSTIAYAYQRSFQYTDSGSLPGASTKVSKNHNIGTSVGIYGDFALQCVSAEGGFSVGDIVSGVSTEASGGPWWVPLQPTIQRNSMFFTTSNFNTFIVINANTGAAFQPTNANWRYMLTAKSTW